MERTPRMSWALFALVTSLAAGGGLGCDRNAAECRHSDECPSGQFCRLGSCEIAPAADTGGIGSDAPRTSTEATRPSTGADDASAERPTDEPTDTRTEQPEASCPDSSPPGPDELVLNEILPNVPTGPRGDANGDGKRDAFDDEFIELVNRSDGTLDLSGVELLESGDTVLTLESACIGRSEGLVVFGGLAEGASLESPEGVTVRVSASRFGFANSGGTFRVRGPNGTELVSFEWTSAPPTSYTLAPQIDGSEYVSHVDLIDDDPMSPGRCPGGEPLSSGCPDPVVEPDARDAGDASPDT